MIKAEYDRESMTLCIEGHAGYAPKGRDIVCAAVSALVYTLINGCQCRIEGESIRAEDNPAVFDAVIGGLIMISQKFPKNLQVVPYRTDVQV